MKSLILLALVCACNAQFRTVLLNPATYLAHEQVKNTEFGYRTKDQARHEYRDANGNVVGAYSYQSPDGKLISRKYSAAADGFKQVGEHYKPEIQRTEYIQHMPIQYSYSPLGYRHYSFLPQKYAVDQTVYRKTGEEMHARKKRDIDDDDLLRYEHLNYRNMHYNMGYNYAPFRYYNTMPMSYNYQMPLAYRTYGYHDMDDMDKRKKREANFAYNVETPHMSQFHKQDNYDKITAYKAYEPMVYRDYGMEMPLVYRNYDYGYNYRTYNPWYYV